MPIAVTEAPYRPVPLDPPRKMWTRAEYEALDASGLFDGEDYELVEGELINRKMGKNRPHINTLVAVQAWLVDTFGVDYVNPEAPIDLAPEDNPTSLPEPDIIVLNRSGYEILKGYPQPAEVRLVVEIASTTLGFDLTKKTGLYARAGIPEYWVFDVPARRLIVHRIPADGRYVEVVAYNEEESVAPLAAPGKEFPVAAAFKGA